MALLEFARLRPGMLCTVRVPGGTLTGRATRLKGRLYIFRADAMIALTPFNVIAVG
jgi:hypothetical protein